jgi:hypothetical protein
VQAGDDPAEPACAWFRRRRLRPGMRFDPVDPATLQWALGTGPRPVPEARPLEGVRP